MEKRLILAEVVRGEDGIAHVVNVATDFSPFQARFFPFLDCEIETPTVQAQLDAAVIADFYRESGLFRRTFASWERKNILLESRDTSKIGHILICHKHALSEEEMQDLDMVRREALFRYVNMV